MDDKAFKKILENYKKVSVEDKIDIYCTTENLSEEQYMILLRNFPMNQIAKLERALV